MWARIIPAAALIVSLGLASARAAPEKEFRGAWVATVYNLDWPSKPGLPAETQKAQLRAILNRAKRRVQGPLIGDRFQGAQGSDAAGRCGLPRVEDRHQPFDGAAADHRQARNGPFAYGLMLRHQARH